MIPSLSLASASSFLRAHEVHPDAFSVFFYSSLLDIHFVGYTVARSARSARSTFSFEAVSLLPAVATSVDSFHHSSRGSDGRSSAIKP